MTDESYDSLRAWLASRPECVQKLAAQFSFDAEYIIDGTSYYLLGYTEQDKLILSPIDPNQNYDAAMSNKIYVCAAHFEKQVEKQG